MMFTTKTGTSWGLPGLVLVQLLVQSLPLPCLCFSRGASGSSCMRMVPGHVHAHPHDPALSPVTLHTPTTYYLPGHLLTVTVRSSRDFMGFLLQARTAARPGLSSGIQGKDAAVQSGLGSGGLGGILLGGSWTLTPPGTHTVRCFSDEDTVTHSDKQPKRNLSFVWRAPDRPMGDVRFYLTVVQSYFVYWTGISSRVLHDGTRSRWRGNSMRQAQLYDEDSIQDQQEVAQTIRASTMKPDVYRQTATDQRKATPLGIQTQNITMSPDFLHNNFRISSANVKIQEMKHNGSKYDRIGTFVRWEHLFEDKATQTDNQDDESNGLESSALSSNETKDDQTSERFVKHGGSGHATMGSFGKEQKPDFGKSIINANKSQQNYTINVVDSQDESSTMIQNSTQRPHTTTSHNTGVNDKIYTTLADQSTRNPFSYTTADSNGGIVASTAKSAKSDQGNTTFSVTLSDVIATSYLHNQKLVKDQTVKPNAATITPIKTDSTPITHSADRDKLLATPKSPPAKRIKDLLLHLDSLIVKDNTTFKTSKAEETQSVTATSDIPSSTVSQTFSTMNDLEKVTLIEHKPTIKSKMNQFYSITSSSEDSKLLRSNSHVDASKLYPPSNSPRRFNATKSTLDISEDATIIRKSLVQNMTDSMSNKTTHSHEVKMERAVSESATSRNISVPSLIFESTKRFLTRPATTTSTFFASQSKRVFAFTSQNSVSTLPINTTVDVNPKWTNSSIQSLSTTATTQLTRHSLQTISENYKATNSRWQSQTSHRRSTIASKTSAATASVQPRYSTYMPTPNASRLHLILTHFPSNFPSSSSHGQSSTLTQPTYQPVAFPNRQASSVVPEDTTHTFFADLSSVSSDNIAIVSKPASRNRSVEASTSVPSYIGGAWSKISSTFDEYWKIIANISKSSNTSGEVKGVEDTVAPYDTTQTTPLSPDAILFNSKQSTRQSNMLAFSTPRVTPATTHSNNFYQQFISSVKDISKASKSSEKNETTTNFPSEMNDNKASLNSWTTSSNTQLEKMPTTIKATNSNQKSVTFPTASKDSINYFITGWPKKQMASKGSKFTTVGPTTEQNSFDFTASGNTNKDTTGLSAENSSTNQMSSYTTVDNTNNHLIFSTVANVQRKLATRRHISTDSQTSNSKSYSAISTRPFPVHLSKSTTDIYATLPTHNNNVTINQQNQSSIHASYQNVNTTPVLVPKGDIFAHEMERKANSTQPAAQYNKTMYEGGTSPNEATTISPILAFYLHTTTKMSSRISPQSNGREDTNVYQKFSTHSMTFVTHKATTLYSKSLHSIPSTISDTKSPTALKITTKISPISIFLNSSTKNSQSTYSSTSNRPKSHSQTSSSAPTSANLLKSTDLVPIKRVLTITINDDERLTKSNTNVQDLPTPSPISSPPNVALFTSSQTSSTSLLSTVLDSSPIKFQPSAARQSLVNHVTTFAPSKAQKPLIDVALPNHSVKPNLPISRISQNTNPNEKPKVEVKAKLPPHLHPDRGGKYPDIIPRHSAWELGMLLGCSAGLGMILVVGIRYVHRKACGKRTQVTLHDREREYSRGDRGLIHVQECGDLVRVRRIRENSFVLLAEYDILATPGD